MKVDYAPHAKLKFRILKKHGVKVTKKQIEDTILRPDEETKGRKGRLIAQKKMAEKYLLRVIYEKKENNIEVITFYPAKRKRYEDQI